MMGSRQSTAFDALNSPPPREEDGEGAGAARGVPPFPSS
jgi:hypothetical protein